MTKGIDKVLAVMKQEGVTVFDILDVSDKPTVDELIADNTCAELRELCKNNGLPSSGNKKVLAQRIYDMDSLRDDFDSEDEDEGCGYLCPEDLSDEEEYEDEWGEEGVDWYWE